MSKGPAGGEKGDTDAISPHVREGGTILVYVVLAGDTVDGGVCLVL
jgi:hypothetical protein